MVICLKRDADLHMAKLMPLPLTVSCFSKIQIGFTPFWYRLTRVVLDKGPLNECVCVCVTGNMNKVEVTIPVCSGVIDWSLVNHWFLIRLAALHHLHRMRHVLVGILGECARHLCLAQTTRIVRAPVPAAQYATATFRQLSPAK